MKNLCREKVEGGDSRAHGRGSTVGVHKKAKITMPFAIGRRNGMKMRGLG
jgi:hypothetical protein